MAPSENSSSQSVVCGRQSFDWSMIDDEFRSIISPVHAGLGSDDISTEEAGELFSQLLLEHLAERGVIKPPSDRNAPSRLPPSHRPRAIVKLTRRLAKLKNQARRTFVHHPGEFLRLVRAHNKAHKSANELHERIGLAVNRNELSGQTHGTSQDLPAIRSPK